VEFRDYLNVLRVRKWIIIQAVIVVTLTALAVSVVQTKQYQSAALVLISEKNTTAALLGSDLPGLSSQPDRALSTQVQLMQTRGVLESTIRRLALETTPEKLLKRVTYSPIGQTNVVKITATDPNPSVAADIANVVAEEYVTSARDAERSSIAAAADLVQKRLADLQTQIIGLGRKIKTTTTSTGETSGSTGQSTTGQTVTTQQSNDLAAELQIAVQTYSTLVEKLEQLQINEQLSTGPGRVVSIAVPESDPSSPKTLRNLGLGLLVGLALGLCVAFLLEYLDSTIKSTDEAERLYGAPVLGAVPIESFKKDEQRRLTIVQHPGSSAAESYRALRNSLDFVNFQHDIKVLLVGSSAPAEGKSTVAANLAAGLAQSGKKVVLLNCDFRRPTTDQFFELTGTVGLSDVLSNRNTLKSALERPGDDELLVLSSGKMPPNPSELLGSSKMSQLISELKEWADWIIVDSPPLLAVADAAAVARWADGVLIVTRAGVSTREAARRGREALGLVGARIVGVVIWGLQLDGSTPGYGYYGGHYGGYYAGYYRSADSDSRDGLDRQSRSSARGAGSDSADSALRDAGAVWSKDAGRSAGMSKRVVVGVTAFIVVLVLVTGAAFLLDRALGLGLFGVLGQLLWNR